jgi:beta-xylosidase
MFLLKFLCSLFLILYSFSSCKLKQEKVFLFSYFTGNGEDGLHLLYSYDGYTWKKLNNGESLLKPDVGNDKLMRDPCIIVGPDSKFHMVWTVSWEEKGIGYANSEDLIHWSPQKYIPVMEHEEKAVNCWAPEITWDSERAVYIIYWATTIPGKFPVTDSIERENRNHRMYYTLTDDFNEFSETRLLYDPGFSVIDAVIKKDGGRYMMVFKDETHLPEPVKQLKLAFSNQLDSGYEKPGKAIGPDWVEGPTLIRKNDEWIIYFDMYTRGKMGAIKSPDLVIWTNITDSLHFPPETRHGTIFEIHRKRFEKIKSSIQ